MGERVYGGSLLVRVERLPEEGFLAEEALLQKAEVERLVDAFSRRYTPLVLLLAALVAFVLPLFWGDFRGHLY